MKSFFNKTLIGVLALSVVGVGFIIRKKKISCNKNKKSNSVKVSDVTGDSLPSKKINFDNASSLREKKSRPFFESVEK
jgi:hypothetical protein